MSDSCFRQCLGVSVERYLIFVVRCSIQLPVRLRRELWAHGYFSEQDVAMRTGTTEDVKPRKRGEASIINDAVSFYRCCVVRVFGVLID